MFGCLALWGHNSRRLRCKEGCPKKDGKLQKGLPYLSRAKPPDGRRNQPNRHQGQFSVLTVIKETELKLKQKIKVTEAKVLRGDQGMLHSPDSAEQGGRPQGTSALWLGERLDRWVGCNIGRVSLGQAPDDNLILKSTKPVKTEKGRAQRASALSHFS